MGSPLPPSDVEIRHSTITGNTAGPFDSAAYPDAPSSSIEPHVTVGGGIHLDVNTYNYGELVVPNVLLDHSIIAGNIHEANEPLLPDHTHEALDLSADFGLDAWPLDFPQVHGSGEPLEEPVYVFQANSIVIGDPELGINQSIYYNLIAFSGSNIIPTDDPGLEPLSDNGAWFSLPDGSKIQTHAVTEESPALDAGTSGTFPDFDERGYPYDRVYGAAIDIGAFELQPIDPPPEPCPPGDYNENGIVDAADYVIWRKHFGQIYQLANEGPGVTPGRVTIEDYYVWRSHFGDTCETSGSGQSILMLTVAGDESDSDTSFFDLSLREALVLAANSSHPGEDIIVIAPWVNEIDLGGTQLSIASGSDVQIIGSGADDVIIDAGGLSRAFNINSGATVTLKGLAVTGGDAGTSTGGAISSQGNLTLEDILIENNTARYGGGIFQSGGSITILRSSIIDNVAHLISGSGGEGGGLSVQSSTVLIDSSTIAANRGTGTYTLGGGLAILDSDLTMRNSTISGNTLDATSTGSGAGLFLGSSYGTYYSAVLTNVTIAGNEIDAYTGEGGGICNVDPGNWGSGWGVADVLLFNTIVADNTLNSGPSDVRGPFDTSSERDLIGWVDGGDGLEITDSIFGGSDFGGVLDPGLGALADNGGPTWTHALLEGSPAIDAGSNSAATGLSYDQRGVGFDRKINGGSSLTVDIGAFEYEPSFGARASLHAAQSDLSVVVRVSDQAVVSSQKVANEPQAHLSAPIGGVFSTNILGRRTKRREQKPDFLPAKQGSSALLMAYIRAHDCKSAHADKGTLVDPSGEATQEVFFEIGCDSPDDLSTDLSRKWPGIT